jgi:hypothetical protein
MSSGGRARKRNLLSGGPKSSVNRSNASASDISDSVSSAVLEASTIEPSLAPSSSKPTQGRQTRQSALSQRTLEPFAFTQTKPAAKQKEVILVEDDDDEIQIIEEPKPKRMNRRKSETKDANVSLIAPDSLTMASTNIKLERQGTPFTSIQTRKEKRSATREVIPDSIAEVDETEQNTSSRSQYKRTQTQAAIDDGLGEAVKAVKKIKLSSASTPANDYISTQANIRSSPPGKSFRKARFVQPTQRISVSEMRTWNGVT